MRNKAYKLPAALDCRYLTEDRQVMIYLWPVPEQKRKRRMSIRSKLRFRRVLRYAFLAAITVAIMLPITLIVLDATYRSRGYWAVGGEFLFLGFLAIGIFRSLNFLL